jgi:hypothetical protein
MFHSAEVNLVNMSGVPVEEAASAAFSRLVAIYDGRANLSNI